MRCCFELYFFPREADGASRFALRRLKRSDFSTNKDKNCAFLSKMKKISMFLLRSMNRKSKISNMEIVLHPEVSVKSLLDSFFPDFLLDLYCEIFAITRELLAITAISTNNFVSAYDAITKQSKKQGAEVHEWVQDFQEK